MPAFLQAIALGSGGVELDLRITRDKQVIICHDDHIRFSDSEGGVYIEDSTLEELRDYCKNSGLVIPTFSEVIQNLRIVREMSSQPSSLIINAELKDPDVTHHIPEILQESIGRDNIGIENFLFNSSDWNAIHELKSNVPDARVCLNVDGAIFAGDEKSGSLSGTINAYAKLRNVKQDLEFFLDSVSCYGIDIKVGYLNDAAIKFCQSRNLVLVTCVSEGNEERELNQKYRHFQRALLALPAVFIKSNNIQFSTALFASMNIGKDREPPSFPIFALTAVC